MEIFHIMALDNVIGREDSVKLHFTTREGRYKQMHLSEEFYGKNLQYTSSQVKILFIIIN